MWTKGKGRRKGWCRTKSRKRRENGGRREGGGRRGCGERGGDERGVVREGWGNDYKMHMHVYSYI